MAETFTYRRGAELPNLTLPWQEETAQNVWTDLDLSTGHTFTLDLVNSSGTSIIDGKTAGIAGSDGSVTVAWAVDELDIATGIYTLKLRARETATSKDRDYQPGDPPKICITT